MEGIKYNWDEMDTLIDEYNSSASVIDNITRELSGIRDMFIFGYVGQASDDLLPELLGKINEHLELLKLCYVGAAKYVQNSKETMKTVDYGLNSLFE